MRFFAPFVVLLVACSTAPLETTAINDFMIDHTFTAIENLKDYTSLQHRGFALAQNVVRHPGPVECRFIYFQPQTYPYKQYLEWCHTPNYKKLQTKMKQSEDPVQRNGIGLRSSADIEKHFDRLKDEFGEYGIHLHHKNFDWEINPTGHRPGWDYLRFKKPLVSDLHFFGVQYEKPAPRAGDILLSQPTVHPNTATAIVGLILKLSPAEYEMVKRFLGVEVRPGVLLNNEHFHVIDANHFPVLLKEFRNKTSSHLAVVLQVKDEKTFILKARPSSKFEWESLQFHVLSTKPEAWDIIATSEPVLSLVGSPVPKASLNR